MSLRDVIARRIAADGPLTFAEYMEVVLYHPELGYYARAGQRSGRAGDFFTSVDVGTLFGEFLAAQIAEMWEHLRAGAVDVGHFDLVEAAAGNGRLARDVLDTATTRYPALYEAARLTLVERSPAARAAPLPLSSLRRRPSRRCSARETRHPTRQAPSCTDPCARSEAPP